MTLFLDRNSHIHRLHPVVRVLGMLGFFVSAFVIERPLWFVPIGVLLAVLVAVSGAWANIVRLRVLFVMVFVMTALIWTVFYGPDGATPLFQWGRLTISRTSPWFALGMAVKLNVFLGAGMVFLTTTRIEDFAYALGCLGVPHRVGFTFTLAFRLVPVFIDAASTVVQAQRCRGLDFEQGSAWQRLRRYVTVIVPVFMGALRRADNMAMALEARGFQSALPRTTLQRYRFGAADAAALALLFALTAGYLALSWEGVLSLRG
jgi:energy-coupling factor transport system permease protein